MKKYKELCSKLLCVQNDSEREELVKEKELMEKDLLPIREELDREKYLGSYSSFEGSQSVKVYFNLIWGVTPSEDMRPVGIN